MPSVKYLEGCFAASCYMKLRIKLYLTCLPTTATIALCTKIKYTNGSGVLEADVMGEVIQKFNL